MKSAVYPLRVDGSLNSQVKGMAKSTGLSEAKTLGQTMKPGLGKAKTKQGRSAPKRSLFESLRGLGPVKLKGR